MLLDAQNQFSNAQAITATAASDNNIDLGPPNYAGTSHGARRPAIHIAVVEAFTAAGAGTLTIQIRDSASSNMGSPRVLDQSPTFALADLVLGADLVWKPNIPVTCRQYVGLNYVVATGPMTAGRITAGAVAGLQTNK